MINRLHKTLGFYEPSLFRIHTIGDGKIKKYQEWSNDEQSCTFLHEYIHFLQDITSIKGLQNIYTNGEYLRYVSLVAKQSQNKTIHLPLDPTKASYNVDQNWILHKETLGNNDTNIQSLIKYNIINKCNITDTNTKSTIKLEIVELECLDYYFNKVKIPFGTIQIMECMAKAIEECAYPNLSGRSPYNPYYIARDLAEMILPGIKTEVLTLIALYDRALQSSNPGLSFVNYLKDIKRKGYNSKTLTPDIIYKELIASQSTNPITNTLAFKDGFNNIATLATGVINDLTGGIWILGNVTCWASTIIKKGISFRFNYPNIFIDIARGGKIQDNKTFQEIIKFLGTPLVTNGKEQSGFIRPPKMIISKSELVNVYAMMQLYSVFMSNSHYKCPLKWYCNNLNMRWLLGPRINAKCDSQPWTKCRFRRCKFVQWWRFKGFKNIRLL